MRHGNLFVISGPSGAGKGTLMALLLQEVPDAWLSISATTRAPREGEVDGVNYHFMTKEHFEELLEHDAFLEWACYSGHYYGTPSAPALAHFDADCQVILEIDVQGAFQVKEKRPDVHMIFIEPPSLEELERRLRNRGTEDEETILRRMEAAKVELSRKEEYDIRIMNDVIDVAKRELVDYVNEQAEL